MSRPPPPASQCSPSRCSAVPCTRASTGAPPQRHATCHRRHRLYEDQVHQLPTHRTCWLCFSADPSGPLSMQWKAVHGCWSQPSRKPAEAFSPVKIQQQEMDLSSSFLWEKNNIGGGKNSVEFMCMWVYVPCLYVKCSFSHPINIFDTYYVQNSVLDPVNRSETQSLTSRSSQSTGESCT